MSLRSYIFMQINCTSCFHSIEKLDFHYYFYLQMIISALFIFMLAFKCLSWFFDSRYLLFACNQAHLVSMYEFELLSMEGQFRMNDGLLHCLLSVREKQIATHFESPERGPGPCNIMKWMFITCWNCMWAKDKEALIFYCLFIYSHYNKKPKRITTIWNGCMWKMFWFLE